MENAAHEQVAAGTNDSIRCGNSIGTTCGRPICRMRWYMENLAEDFLPR